MREWECFPEEVIFELKFKDEWKRRKKWGRSFYSMLHSMLDLQTLHFKPNKLLMYAKSVFHCSSKLCTWIVNHIEDTHIWPKSLSKTLIYKTLSWKILFNHISKRWFDICATVLNWKSTCSIVEILMIHRIVPLRTFYFISNIHHLVLV